MKGNPPAIREKVGEVSEEQKEGNFNLIRREFD